MVDRCFSFAGHALRGGTCKPARVRTYEIAPERFKVVEDWLTARRQLWEARPDRFDHYVKQLKAKESAS